MLHKYKIFRKKYNEKYINNLLIINILAIFDYQKSDQKYIYYCEIKNFF